MYYLKLEPINKSKWTYRKPFEDNKFSARIVAKVELPSDTDSEAESINTYDSLPNLVPIHATQDYQDQLAEGIQNLLGTGAITIAPPPIPVDTLYSGTVISQVVHLTGNSFKLVIQKNSVGRELISVRNRFTYVDDFVDLVYRIEVNVTQYHIECLFPVELTVSDIIETSLESETFLVYRAIPLLVNSANSTSTWV